MTVKPKTVSELRAILDARAPYAAAIKDALLRGDLEGCAKAQKAMREKFVSDEDDARRAAHECTVRCLIT